MPLLELSIELGELSPDAAETACFATGALSVSFSDVADDPVLEPRPGELRLWRRTRLQALYGRERAEVALSAADVAEKARAEDITLLQWRKIAEKLL